MEVYALYGPSGTGKSTSALTLAHKYRIPAIIDDGLLIYQGRKIAGHSAKYEKTTFQAVKRAIFHDPEHAGLVKEALKDCHPERLLVLGTSLKMIQRIVEALELPEVHQFVNISEIRSPAEMKAAQFERETQGRHVIPIPRMQVEQDFIKRLIARVEQAFSAKKEELGETTIVHPQFHSGRIHISEQVLKKLVQYSCDSLPEVKFHRIRAQIGDIPVVEIDIRLAAAIDQPLLPILEAVQMHIHQAFLDWLNIELEQIDITLSQLVPVSVPQPLPSQVS